MKLYISLAEYTFKALFLFILTIILKGFINPVVFYYLTRVYLVFFILCFFYLLSIVLGKVLGKKKLPGWSYKNILGFIELHIDESHKGSRKKFYEICADTILVAHELKKNVLFDTWLIEPDELKNRLGDAVEVRKCPLTIRALFKFLKVYYSSNKKERFKKNKKKMHRYIIHTDRLNTDHIQYLNRMSSKKERVIN